jgi:folylpolyglutamate synthase
MPNWFGFLTLLAFDIFAACELDVVILEVGLGGRLDATNVIERPDVTAITLLDLDHTEFLGDTIEEIAGEKAGIMKRGVSVITVDCQEPNALEVLRAKADQVGCPLEVEPPCPPDWALGLSGDYQRSNASVAVRLFRCIAPGDDKNDEAIRRGLLECKWPGRGQIVRLSSRVTMYVDGAHTPKSIMTASDWFLSELQQASADADGSAFADEAILLFSCMHSRNPKLLFESMGAAVAQSFSTVIFTPTISSKPTAVKMPTASEIMGYPVADDSKNSGRWVDVLAKVWKEVFPENNQLVIACSTLNEAVEKLGGLSANTGPAKRVFVTGSLLLIGDVYKIADIPAA